MPVPGVRMERGVLLGDEGLGVAEARGAEAERVGDGQQDERGGHGALRGHPVDAPVLRQEGGEGRGRPLAVVRRSVEAAARSLLGVARRALREVARHRPGRIEHRPRGPPPQRRCAGPRSTGCRCGTACSSRGSACGGSRGTAGTGGTLAACSAVDSSAAPTQDEQFRVAAAPCRCPRRSSRGRGDPP